MDPGVHLGCGQDQVRGQRPGEVDVAALPAADLVTVHLDVVTDPRQHVVLAPGVERLPHQRRISLAVQ
jgi:hypothetical protein